MKYKAGQLLSHPKTVYLASAFASVLLGAIAVGIFFFPENEARNITLTIMVFSTILAAWISWLSHVLSSRKSTKALVRNVQIQLADTSRDIQKKNEQLWKTIAATNTDIRETNKQMVAELSKAQQNNMQEYNKQSYNVLVGLQDLRLSMLETKDQSPFNE